MPRSEKSETPDYTDDFDQEQQLREDKQEMEIAQQRFESNLVSNIAGHDKSLIISKIEVFETNLGEEDVSEANQESER
jgi:hypothetical protein